jgi:acetylornithine/N-succinyldiaminopimelate aminotransferase
VNERGAYLRAQLLKLSEEFGLAGERGEGLLRALLLGKDIGGQLVEAAREMNPTGLLLNAPRPNILRFMPALNVTTDEIDTMIGMLRTLLKAHA